MKLNYMLKKDQKILLNLSMKLNYMPKKDLKMSLSK